MGIIFVMNDGLEIAFEKQVWFSERISVYKGYHLIQQFSPISEFTWNWEHPFRGECERQVITERRRRVPRSRKFKPTKFMLPTSHYDVARADRAVAFIQSLKHTKSVWSGKPFILLPWQEEVIRNVFGVVKENGYRQFSTAFVECPKKQGKELALDTPIPTPTGWSTMGDLQIGNVVFDEHGHSCHAIAKSQVDDTETAYRLTFRDGSSIVAGERHLWNVDKLVGKTEPVVWDTGTIYRETRRIRENYRREHDLRRSVIRIHVAAPLQTADALLPCDPYLYGYWLGNGSATKPEITVRTSDVEQIIENVPYTLHNRFPQKCGGSDILTYAELKPILVKHFRDKVIRPEYLRASERQRWALLQGLIDSDGSICGRKAQSTYTSTILPLAESVRELLWSLGIKNAMHSEPSTRNGVPTGETLYTIRFTTFEGQPTSRLERKIGRKRERIKETRSCFHYLEDIEPLGTGIPMQCIQVDSASHCYLAGRSFQPTTANSLPLLRCICSARTARKAQKSMAALPTAHRPALFLMWRCTWSSRIPHNPSGSRSWKVRNPSSTSPLTPITRCSPLRLPPSMATTSTPVSLTSWYPKRTDASTILLVCDGAAWHKSKSLIAPSNIHLLNNPPYTPEMNPIEQIWKQLRSMGFRNEVFNRLDDAIDRLCETIRQLSSEMIQSITARVWI